MAMDYTKDVILLSGMDAQGDTLKGGRGRIIAVTIKAGKVHDVFRQGDRPTVAGKTLKAGDAYEAVLLAVQAAQPKDVRVFRAVSHGSKDAPLRSLALRYPAVAKIEGEKTASKSIDIGGLLK